MSASYPIIGAANGPRHLSNTFVLNGGHSDHPLQRAGQVPGNLAPVIPGGAKGVGVGNGPAAGGFTLGMPSLLNLDPIGGFHGVRIT